MIPSNTTSSQPSPWQKELACAIRDPAELLALLDLDPSWLAPARAAAQLFPLRVPRGFAARMHKGDPADPLLRQVLPLAEERLRVPGYSADPVGDLASRLNRGLLQKYHGRVLLIATGACAVHCRYCFRRHFPYGRENARLDRWLPALRTIRADTSISEVILSGGDPLTLRDERLAELVSALEEIPHLKTLRIHTRWPIVLPVRIDDPFLAWFAQTRLQRVIVVHANHAREIDDAVCTALARLTRTGATLLNQSVLLRGVNDSVETLVDLSNALFAAGVLPYYLHALDRVAGTAHFEVPEAEAIALYHQLSARLPGYLVPRLVREVPGAASKTPLIGGPAAADADARIS